MICRDPETRAEEGSMITRTRSLAIATTRGLVLALGAGAQTPQNDQDHSAHHPDAAQAQAAPQTVPTRRPLSRRRAAGLRSPEWA